MPETMMLTEKEKLTIFRICIEGGLISLEQIENWADNILIQSPEVRFDYILDLCQSKSAGINETIHVLKKNEAIITPVVWQVLYGIAGFLFESKKIDLEKACYFISKIINEVGLESEYDLFGMSLDDTFYLASREIYGNLNSTKDEFISITNQYKNLAKNFLSEISREY